MMRFDIKKKLLLPTWGASATSDELKETTRQFNKQWLVVVFIMVCSSFFILNAHAAKSNNKTEEVDFPNLQETKNEAKSNPFDAPYPFTANEFAEKLLKVLDSPDGFISKEQVEAIFNLSLPELDRSNRIVPKDKSKLFGVTGGRDWYFTLIVGDNNPQHSYFVFEWAKPPGINPSRFLEAPESMCIDPVNMMKGIEQRGWKLKSETRIIDQPIPFANYYRQGIQGGIHLTISRRTKCLLGIRMSASVLNSD